MFDTTVTVVVMKRTRNARQDRKIGEFNVKHFEDGNYDAIVRRAKRLYGAEGWDLLQIRQRTTTVVDILEWL